MKSVSATLQQEIRSGYSVKALPHLIADWNMNRYKAPVADNDPSEYSEGYDVEMFPIESIVKPLRPTKGILKARINESAISSEYGDQRDGQYYIGTVDDQYKYWTSPTQSDGSGNITDVNPYIVYDENVNVNKIVITVENTWATPANCGVYIQTAVNGAWSKIASNPTVANDGRIVLYWNGTGWSSNRPSDVSATRSIRGIKFQVTSLSGGKTKLGTSTFYRGPLSGGYSSTAITNGRYSFFSLIEISAHLEMDLSDRVITTSDNFDMSESSFIYPVGTITSNTGSVVLDNSDGFFDDDNQDSPVHDILESNVEFNLQYLYDIGGGSFPVQQFVMYSDNFSGRKEDTVTVALSDYSKYLKEITPSRMMYQNLSAMQIIWRLCDSVGFNKYNVDPDDIISHSVIPVFWTSGDKTLWEIFDELSQATQTAIYFDGWGTLQVKTREAAFKDSATPVWTLRGQTQGTELADIVTLEQTEEFESNYVSVSYKDTKWDKEMKVLPVTQKVWEPDGTVVLRATDLRKSISDTDMRISIPSDEIGLWPYSGIVQIEGEIITYDGKEFVYFTGDNAQTRHTVIIHSAAERSKYGSLSPDLLRYKNYLTGDIVVTERGAWNSEAKSHSVDTNTYVVRTHTDGGDSVTTQGFRQLKTESKVLMQNPANFTDANDFLVATRGNPTDSGYYYYGTKLQFVKGSGNTTQQAGIMIHGNGAGDDGYYIEIKATDTLDIGTKKRPNNEVRMFSVQNRVRKGIGPLLGVPFEIVEGIDYEIDVAWSKNNVLSCWINGKQVSSAVIPSGQRIPWGGRFGMVIRGKTQAKFEYLYAVARDEGDQSDDFSFLDKVYTGYVGNKWDRDWVYKWRDASRRIKKKSGREKVRWNQMYFDEFGPIIHEVREFNVDFDPAPVWGSYLYLTNDWQAICTEYRSSPFGAHFILANTSRQNAVINGEDTLSLGVGDASTSVGQVLTVMGRVLVVSDAQTVVSKDDDAILRRGKIESQIDSDWVQSKDAAQEIADWIKKHWSTGIDQQSVEIFGNPLIEVGDVVAVDYPRKGMSPDTHKYFVTGVENSFDAGISTTLTLRRVV